MHGPTLSHMTTGREVVSQVMNTSLLPVTVYKGIKLAWRGHPRMQRKAYGQEKQTAPNHSKSVPDFDLDSTDLTSTEKSQLRGLWTEVSDLFTCRGGHIGQTPMVKHPIVMEGPPIRQPIRRLPEMLKTMVNNEVEKMLKQGVVKTCSSLWSCPIVIV